jgi:hypothetical protein
MVRAGVIAIAALSACRLETEGIGPRDAAVDADAPPPDTAVVLAEDVALEDSPPRVVVDTAEDSDDYFLVDAPHDWYDARDECIKLGGHLATITSAKELERAKAIGSGDRWLGLRKDADAGVFAWITGEGFALDAWKSGEPNGTGSCAKMVEGGAWWDHSCLEPLPALCERD